MAESVNFQNLISKTPTHGVFATDDKRRTTDKNIECYITDLGLVDYRKAWKLQTDLVDARINKIITSDIVLLLEHPPVFTLGRRGGDENLLVSASFLEKSGISVIQVERGGNITYHGPGQLVVYFIMNLQALRIAVVEFVEALEEAMLQTVGFWGIRAQRNPANRGIWVGDKKMGSIGIALRKGVSFHGLALNVNLDLTPFSWIQPCGLQGVQMTSMKQELSRDVSVPDVRNVLKEQLEAVLGVALISKSDTSLRSILKTQQSQSAVLVQKPGWLKRRLPTGPTYEHVSSMMRKDRLHTVCQEAKCPNIWECFTQHTATFLILGSRCTRNCRFCSVEAGPVTPPDPDEPVRVAEVARRMGLKYVVVTSVTRDDMPDGGAGIFAKTIEELRKQISSVCVEVLIPDFQGSAEALQTVVHAQPDVLNHNIETVPRLYPLVRPGADYNRSLELLQRVQTFGFSLPTKSGLMLGFGEGHEEVKKSLEDLLKANCRILTLGQYLQPTKKHLAVKRFIPPEEFEQWRDTALKMGFSEVASGPFVRSSYHAKELFQAVKA
jgi:lipoic acid synthetase